MNPELLTELHKCGMRTLYGKTIGEARSNYVRRCARSVVIIMKDKVLYSNLQKLMIASWQSNPNVSK